MKEQRVPGLYRILVLIAIVYAASGKGFVQVSDTALSIQTADRLVTAGALDIPASGGTLTAADGRSYSKYGPGLALYYVPIIAAAHGLSGLSPVPVDVLISFLISFASIPFAVLTLFVFAALLRQWGADESESLLFVLALGLGTLIWRYAVYDFSEAMQATLLLVGIYSVIRRTDRALLIGGAAVGGLILVKAVYVLFVPLFAVYLAVTEVGARRRILRLATFFAPVAAALGFILLLNQLRFGSPFESGCGSEAAQFVPAQMWRTIPMLLASADKGMLVFGPVLILGVLGWREFHQRHPAEALLLAGIVCLDLVIAAAWHSWEGGLSWGPRLLVPTIPLWLIPAFFWTRIRLQKPGGSALLIGLIMVSIVSQIPGILVNDQEIHHVKYNVLTEQERGGFPSEYVASWIFLRHKLEGRDEIYSASELGLDSQRTLDLRESETFVGLNLWTEHVARRFGVTAVRWLGLVGIAALAWLLVELARIGISVTWMQSVVRSHSTSPGC